MTGRKIGYARTAVASGEIGVQIERLRAAGCTEIFEDNGHSGNDLERPGLKSALAALDTHDTFVVCDIKCLSRNISGTVRFIKDIARRDNGFLSLDAPCFSHDANPIATPIFPPTS